MERMQQLMAVIDEIVRQNPDKDESRCGFVHLYGVSAICTLLALKRARDPELCSVAGLLHDIWNYKVEDNPAHASLGSGVARQILNQTGGFTPSEVEMICSAIARHSDKQSIDGEMDELLKDADVFQHYLYNPSQYIASLHRQGKSPTIRRLERVLVEMGINASL